ncbi:hypothetical protein TGRUB_225440 [Toxoplasma gondii RUB]|uniref:Uncharacterized protein n=1 Tax=Toxoplasma gondii RUB TaxID=935652 RepID=A0A086LW08_TOXGO|nr:hypothetical protein TGRUB_225440 [Toxoplasma gondii RUB]
MSREEQQHGTRGPGEASNVGRETAGLPQAPLPHAQRLGAEERHGGYARDESGLSFFKQPISSVFQTSHDESGHPHEQAVTKQPHAHDIHSSPPLLSSLSSSSSSLSSSSTRSYSRCFPVNAHRLAKPRRGVVLVQLADVVREREEREEQRRSAVAEMSRAASLSTVPATGPPACQRATVGWGAPGHSPAQSTDTAGPSAKPLGREGGERAAEEEARTQEENACALAQERRRTLPQGERTAKRASRGARALRGKQGPRVRGFSVESRRRSFDTASWEGSSLSVSSPASSCSFASSFAPSASSAQSPDLSSSSGASFAVKAFQRRKPSGPHSLEVSCLSPSDSRLARSEAATFAASSGVSSGAHALERRGRKAARESGGQPATSALELERKQTLRNPGAGEDSEKDPGHREVSDDSRTEVAKDEDTRTREERETQLRPTPKFCAASLSSGTPSKKAPRPASTKTRRRLQSPVSSSRSVSRSASRSASRSSSRSTCRGAASAASPPASACTEAACLCAQNGWLRRELKGRFTELFQRFSRDLEGARHVTSQTAEQLVAFSQVLLRLAHQSSREVPKGSEAARERAGRDRASTDEKEARGRPPKRRRDAGERNRGDSVEREEMIGEAGKGDGRKRGKRERDERRRDESERCDEGEDSEGREREETEQKLKAPGDKTGRTREKEAARRRARAGRRPAASAETGTTRRQGQAAERGNGTKTGAPDSLGKVRKRLKSQTPWGDTMRATKEVAASGQSEAHSETKRKGPEECTRLKKSHQRETSSRATESDVNAASGEPLSSLSVCCQEDLSSVSSGASRSSPVSLPSLSPFSPLPVLCSQGPSASSGSSYQSSSPTSGPPGQPSSSLGCENSSSAQGSFSGGFSLPPVSHQSAPSAFRSLSLGASAVPSPSVLSSSPPPSAFLGSPVPLPSSSLSPSPFPSFHSSSPLPFSSPVLSSLALPSASPLPLSSTSSSSSVSPSSSAASVSSSAEVGFAGIPFASSAVEAAGRSPARAPECAHVTPDAAATTRHADAPLCFSEERGERARKRDIESGHERRGTPESREGRETRKGREAIEGRETRGGGTPGEGSQTEANVWEKGGRGADAARVGDRAEEAGHGESRTRGRVEGRERALEETAPERGDQVNSESNASSSQEGTSQSRTSPILGTPLSKVGREQEALSEGEAYREAALLSEQGVQQVVSPRSAGGTEATQTAVTSEESESSRPPPPSVSPALSSGSFSTSLRSVPVSAQDAVASWLRQACPSDASVLSSLLPAPLLQKAASVFLACPTAASGPTSSLGAERDSPVPNRETRGSDVTPGQRPLREGQTKKKERQRHSGENRETTRGRERKAGERGGEKEEEGEEKEEEGEENEEGEEREGGEKEEGEEREEGEKEEGEASEEENSRTEGNRFGSFSNVSLASSFSKPSSNVSSQGSSGGRVSPFSPPSASPSSTFPCSTSACSASLPAVGSASSPPSFSTSVAGRFPSWLSLGRAVAEETGDSRPPPGGAAMRAREHEGGTAQGDKTAGPLSSGAWTEDLQRTAEGARKGHAGGEQNERLHARFSGSRTLGEPSSRVESSHIQREADGFLHAGNDGVSMKGKAETQPSPSEEKDRASRLASVDLDVFIHQRPLSGDAVLSNLYTADRYRAGIQQRPGGVVSGGAETEGSEETQRRLCFSVLLAEQGRKGADVESWSTEREGSATGSKAPTKKKKTRSKEGEERHRRRWEEIKRRRLNLEMQKKQATGSQRF